MKRLNACLIAAILLGAGCAHEPTVRESMQSLTSGPLADAIEAARMKPCAP